MLINTVKIEDIPLDNATNFIPNGKLISNAVIDIINVKIRFLRTASDSPLTKIKSQFIHAICSTIIPKHNICNNGTQGSHLSVIITVIKGSAVLANSMQAGKIMNDVIIMILLLNWIKALSSF